MLDQTDHPMKPFLRLERIPHIWCPGCGIGIATNCFIRALIDCDIPPQQVSLISGIGCTGRVAGYLKLDSFHTTHGRAIPFAIGLKMANPHLKVVVFSGDGDLAAIGGNHLIHAARRNIDITIVCVNNFNYAMTGGQMGPTTPEDAITSTTTIGSVDHPFNLPFLVDSCGAVYVSRWTTFHVRQLRKSIAAALLKKGFSFVEIISPCPTLYERRNKLGTGLDRMKFFKDNSVIVNGANTREVSLVYQEKIRVGNFVDRERATYNDAMQEHFKTRLGDKYKEPEVIEWL